MVVDLSIHRQCCVPVDVRDWLDIDFDSFKSQIIGRKCWIKGWPISHLSSRKKSIDGESLVGEVAVAEAGDSVPVGASVAEQLRETGEKIVR